MEEKKLFGKIKSDNLLSYLCTFFNLSDIRTLFLLSKRFIKILNKDNKKIIREIQEKIFGSVTYNELILKELKMNKHNIINYTINKSPIINSILGDNYLISSSYKFDNSITIYDLNYNKINQIISFNDDNNYFYISSILYIKEKKLLLVGTINGHIIGYIFAEKEKHFNIFWEYKTGFKNEIKKIIYYVINNKIIVICLDSDDSAKINFLRVFYCQNSYNNDNKINVNYIKSYIIKNYQIYNIKYFEDKNNINFFALSLNDRNCLEDINNELINNFKFDTVSDNNISILSDTKIQINFNNIEDNKDFLLKNDTYEELIFDYSLTGHKSFICDYLYLKNENIIISIEYLSPYLFIWNLDIKKKINMILLPHTDSILCLLNISGKYISSSGRDRKIFIYPINEILSNIYTDKPIINYQIECNHSSDIYKINYYKDNLGNNKIISSSFDKTIKIFKMNENFDKVLSKIILTGHSSSISCVKMDLLRKEIITIDNESIINRWEYNKKEKFYIIKKSIELNKVVNKKKEYIDDIILLYDNLNSIIKIDRTKNIKVFSLSREEFLYEYSEKNDKILKIVDCCNFNNFICYTSNNLIKIYTCKIQKKDNYNYNFCIKNIFDINIDNINFKQAKMSSFKLLTWKYKLLGIGYNNGKIVIMKIKNNQYKNLNITNKQYLIDITSHINKKNNNNKINQIKYIEYYQNEEEYLIYLIFSVNNFFFIYSITPNSIENLNINFINKIENKNDIIFFEILNRNLIVSSSVNNCGIEFIYLPKYIKNENNFLIIDDNPLIDFIQLSNEYINKIIYTKNKKGIVCISNNYIKYLEFSKI